jgi:hypothetical protein
MMTEDRLQDAMAACRAAASPSPGFFDRLDERTNRSTQHRRRMRVAMAVAATVAVVAGAVAVGEHQRSTGGAEARLKQQFVVQANEICDRAIQQVNGLRPRVVQTPNEMTRILDRESSIDEAAISALGALPTPPSDRATVTAMLSHFDEALGAARVMSAVSVAKPPAGADTVLAALSEQIGRASKDALDYGLNRCAQLSYPAS